MADGEPVYTNKRQSLIPSSPTQPPPPPPPAPLATAHKQEAATPKQVTHYAALALWQTACHPA